MVMEDRKTRGDREPPAVSGLLLRGTQLVASFSTGGVWVWDDLPTSMPSDLDEVGGG
jgi:hypothetical protein